MAEALGASVFFPCEKDFGSFGRITDKSLVGGFMDESLTEYQRALSRVPHVRRVDIQVDPEGNPRVHVVSDSEQSPRHLVRELVSLLRSYGWSDVQADHVMVVKVQQEYDKAPGLGRLRITGYAVGYGIQGYEAECRLGQGVRVFSGHSTSPNAQVAMAEATLDAVNQAIGQTRFLSLVEITTLTVAGIALVVALVMDSDREVMAGNAMLREVAEDSVVRAVLDAVNRRFVLFTGQKV